MNQLIHQISFGDKSYVELLKSIKSIHEYNDTYIQILSDRKINLYDAHSIQIDLVNQLDNTYDYRYNPVKSSRFYKTKLNEYSSEYNLYLDSDTVVKSKDIEIMFRLLDDYDLVICLSSNQESDSFWHIEELERNYTYEQLGFIPLQLQCGVFSWRQNEYTNKLFEQWNKEWLIFQGQDQCAFVRALYKCPLRIYLLGQSFNSSNGSVIEHHFGKIR